MLQCIVTLQIIIISKLYLVDGLIAYSLLARIKDTYSEVLLKWFRDL